MFVLVKTLRAEQLSGSSAQGVLYYDKKDCKQKKNLQLTGPIRKIQSKEFYNVGPTKDSIKPMGNFIKLFQQPLMPWCNKLDRFTLKSIFALA